MGITFGSEGSGEKKLNVPLLLQLLKRGAPAEMQERVKEVARKYSRGEDVSMEAAALAADFETWQKKTKPPDKWIIEHPETWYHRRFLVMFKPHPTGVVQMGQPGYILHHYLGWPDEKTRRTVWVGASVFDCLNWDVDNPGWEKVRGHCYPSIDAMLADGWEVDT
jgi:hypothetical protein